MSEGEKEKIPPFEAIEKITRNMQKEDVEDRVEQKEERQNIRPNYNDNSEYENNKRLTEPADFNPTNSIDVAHLLLSPSELTSFMPELDKEIKLGNLNKEEKNATWEFQSVWDDVMWMREQQKRKIEEFEELYGRGSYIELNPEDYRLHKVTMDNLDSNTPSIFDTLSLLRKSQRIPTLSRGKGGFERGKQVQTISTNVYMDEDTSESKPGFMSKWTGGFKK